MDTYDLATVVSIVLKYNYKRVALQFPDEELPKSIAVYLYLRSQVDSVDFFITADSTWGSSVDDVSAMHYDADLLVYFGSDLSSSGSLPVMIVPALKKIDVIKSMDVLSVHLTNTVTQELDCPLTNCLLLFELGYSSCILDFVDLCKVVHLIPGQLPRYADLKHWEPHIESIPLAGNICGSKSEMVKIGGLFVEKDILEKPDLHILYIGEKSEQIVNIILRASSHSVMCYSPQTEDFTVVRGCESREFRERYGGVLRVKDANVVGIIIGSMGLTAETTRDVIHRLQTLITAANKKYYVFVMGRLNESKLCNFPEVDVFCLVSNDDNANIKPKTFHVPVITPFELELGLGARPWTSTFSTDIVGLVGDGNDLSSAVESVRDSNPPAHAEDSDDEEHDCGDAGMRIRPITENHSDIIQLSGTSVDQAVQLYSKSSGGQLSVFSSAAADFFRTRDYQGLVAEVPAGHDTTIQAGTFGTSIGYTQNTGAN